MLKSTFNVKGMTCTACEQIITEALEEVGAKQVKVNHTSGLVVVEHDDDMSETVMKRTIVKEGFKVEE